MHPEGARQEAVTTETQRHRGGRNDSPRRSRRARRKEEKKQFRMLAVSVVKIQEAINHRRPEESLIVIAKTGPCTPCYRMGRYRHAASSVGDFECNRLFATVITGSRHKNQSPLQRYTTMRIFLFGGEPPLRGAFRARYRKLRISMASEYCVPRESTSCLPSRDQAKSKMSCDVKLVSLLGVPPSLGTLQILDEPS